MVLKILIFLLIFASAFLVKELYQFIRALINYKDGDVYKISTLRLIFIGVAFAYILTIIITGFGL